MNTLPKHINVSVSDEGKMIVLIGKRNTSDIPLQSAGILNAYFNELSAKICEDVCYEIVYPWVHLRINKDVGIFVAGEFYNIEFGINKENMDYIALYQEK